jgi:hypothetical protein
MRLTSPLSFAPAAGAIDIRMRDPDGYNPKQ